MTRFLLDNLVNSETISASQTLDSGFELSNLWHPHNSKMIRASNESELQFDLDFGAFETVDTVAIATTELVPERVDITFGNTVVNYQVTTEDARTNVIRIPVPEGPALSMTVIVHFPAHSGRAELSKLWIGQSTTIGMSNDISSNGFSFSQMENIKVATNAYGQRFIDRYNSQNTIKCKIEYMNTEEFNRMHDISINFGKSRPFWVFFTLPDNPQTFDGRYFLKSDLKFGQTKGLLWNVSLDLVEAS